MNKICDKLELVKKMLTILLIVFAFVYTNFFWWRYVAYGLATSSRGIGFPIVYSRRLCGDTIPIQCGAWSEEGKLILNVLIWIGFMLVVISIPYLLRKRKI